MYVFLTKTFLMIPFFFGSQAITKPTQTKTEFVEVDTDNRDFCMNLLGLVDLVHLGIKKNIFKLRTRP